MLYNENDAIQDEVLPDSYFQYSLKGTIIHLGVADSGHYYSIIKNRNNSNEWYEFNDKVVRYFDEKDLPNEAFGGEEKGAY